MAWWVTKYLITAGLVVAVSEFAKRSGRLGGLVAALPLVSVLTLVWLHAEGEPPQKMADYARYTFWYVVPTLPMFLAFPWLLPRLGFWPTLAACVLITVLCLGVLAWGLKHVGIELL